MCINTKYYKNEYRQQNMEMLSILYVNSLLRDKELNNNRSNKDHRSLLHKSKISIHNQILQAILMRYLHRLFSLNKIGHN